MHVARFVLVCLLGLAVAVQGYAGARVTEPSCSMSHPVAAHHEAMGDQHGGEHSAHATAHVPQPQLGDSVVCTDAGHCSCAMGCQPAHFPAAAMRPAVLQQVAGHAPAAMTPTFRSHTVCQHWRPPALPI